MSAQDEFSTLSNVGQVTFKFMSFGALILRMRVNDTHLHQSLSQYGQLPKRPGGVLHRKDSVVNKVFQDLVFRGVGSGKLSDSYKVYKGDGNWLAGLFLL